MTRTPLSLSVALAAMAGASAQIQWQPVPALPALSGHAMAHDAARGVTVLFGGTQTATGQVYDHTLQLFGSLWVDPQPAVRPSPRLEHALAYDAARQRVVLFGGRPTPAGAALGDTWEWDGSTWLMRAPTTAPPARCRHAMVFDPRRGRVVLSGGLDPSTQTPLADLWDWDGTTWSQWAPAPTPPARSGHGLTFDGQRGRLVLFGGESATTSPPALLADTWEWDGSLWQAVIVSGPSARRDHTLTYDPVRNQTVLFGGQTLSGARLLESGETWLWDGLQWTVQRVAGPSPRLRHAAAFDAAAGAVTLFGGLTDSGEDRDTWRWNGSAWTQGALPAAPAPRGDYGLAYDAARGRLVLFGGARAGRIGAKLGDTWEWDGSQWLALNPPLAPAPRDQLALAYDAARQRTVLFGGRDASYQLFADTWEWDGTVWTWRSPAQSPPDRHGHALAYDGARQRVVLFGGNGNLTDLADTWEWDGTIWSQRTPAAAPAPRWGHALAYDAARGRTVLFGGYPTLGDTWEWDGIVWTQRTPAGSPAPRYSPGLAFDAARGRTVLFGGFGALGVLDDTWEWDGATWRGRSPAVRPPARSAVGLAYDAVRNVCVLFSGQIIGAQLADQWQYVNTTPAAFRPLGPGCAGSQGIPGLTATTGPWLGEAFTATVDHLPAPAAVLLLVGSSSTRYGGIPLPLDLGPAGLSGCFLRTSIALTAGLPNQAGRAPWSIGIPLDPSLVGGQFHVQAAATDPTANPAGVILSDAATAVLGSK